MQRHPEYARIRAGLERSAHFGRLPAEDVSRLAAIARVRKLRRGQSAAPGTPRHPELWIILDGWLRVSSVTAQGKEVVYAFIGPGNFYGLGEVVRSAPHPTEVRAASAVSLAVIPGDRLLRLLDERPRLWRHVATLLYERLLLTLGLVRDISVAPLAQRIARRLLWQAMSAAGGTASGGPVELRISQADLGRMLAAGRSQVSSELGRLERLGLIKLGYRTLELVDIPRLRELAGPDLPSS